MPKAAGKSGIGAKLAQYGINQSHAAHKNDEIKISAGGDLPAGIEGGIAQIVECKLSEYKTGKLEGEPFFMASAVVVEPAKYAGSRTNFGPEALCDTPQATGKKKTFDDHYSYVLNGLKNMGAKDAVEAMEDAENELPGICEAVKNSGIYIRFRTWAGDVTPEYPTPSVNHDWRGVAEGYTPEDTSSNAVNVAAPAATPAPKTVAGAPVKKTAVTKTATPAATPAVAPVKKAATKKAAPPKPNLDEMTLEEVAALANVQENTTEQKYLTDKALEVGIDKTTVENSKNWEAVVELINAANNPDTPSDDAPDYENLGLQADAGDAESVAALQELAAAAGIDPNDYGPWADLAAALAAAAPAGDAGPGETPAEEFAPIVGDIYMYAPINPTTKKPAPKPLEHEVLKVDQAKRTLTLKNLTDNKISNNVSFDALAG